VNNGAARPQGATVGSFHAAFGSGRVGKLGCFGIVAPVVYVWSLPLLGHLGFAHHCKHFPKCKNVGASVSNFISTPMATGAMAACFFFPTMHLWLNVQHVGHIRCILPTLFVFQVCFGVFLSCPVDEVHTLHGIATCFFCVAALTHYSMVLRYTAYDRYRWCKLLLCLAILSFAMVFVLVCISFYDKNLLPERCPYLFYVFEALGLSTMAVFPIVWTRDRGEAGVQLGSFLDNNNNRNSELTAHTNSQAGHGGSAQTV